MEKKKLYSSEAVKRLLENVNELKADLMGRMSGLNVFNPDFEAIKENLAGFAIGNVNKIIGTFQLLQVTIVNLSNSVKDLYERIEKIEVNSKGE
jgi:phage-related protein